MPPSSHPEIIIPLEPDHLLALAEVVRQNDPSLPQMMLDDVGAWLAKGRTKGEAYFTALIEGFPIGMTGYKPDPWGVPDIAWLVWLYIAPQCKRRGVARRLFAHAQAELQSLGVRKVCLDVGNEAQHQAAIAFHKADGFVQEAHLRDYWCDGEDFLIFSKRL